MWNWSKNQIKLLFIRHGETASNKEQRYLGKTEENLSREGKEKLEKKKNELFYPKVDYLFSSPMGRCLETAAILYPEKDCGVIAEWEEMDFGAFEGKNYKDLHKDKRYQDWIDSNGTLPFPEGESREEFIERCKSGFYKMLETVLETASEKSGCDIVVGLIVHGGTIMALLSSFYGGEYFDYQTYNGQGFSCKLESCGEKLQFTALERI